MNIDIGRSASYAFEDPKWTTKVGILVFIGLIPGLNVIVWGGYALSIARRIMHREQYPLPEWTEWSDIAVRGLLAIAATFLYYLPAIFISCCLFAADWLLGERLGGTLVAVRCCGNLFALVYVLAANLVLNTAHVRYVQTDQFNGYLDIGRRINDLRTNLSFFGTLFLYQLLLAVLASAAAGILAITCIGAVLILTIAFLANGYILGSAAAAATPATAGDKRRTR